MIELANALGAKLKIAALFEFGLFEEIILVDKGKQNLKEASSDNPLYGYIVEVLKLITDNISVPDFLDETERLGYMGPLFAIQSTKTTAK
ncbi:hypothetical protein [uncultured Maribacter sp.]|uniref:hypothetical protein n=1 Tax=uncultured Maribacter sp. TaxID=431308 RepID=UPI0026099092|nr:hypothetical protein [uncultured Maribacter sp.]